MPKKIQQNLNNLLKKSNENDYGTKGDFIVEFLKDQK
jgi:hypothetical protein